MSSAIILAAAITMGVPVEIDEEMLAGLPQTVAVLSAHGQSETCEGPRLRDLIVDLGLPAGHELRGPALTRGVVISARDGYAVLFSLGELDALLGASDAILALRCDGKPLDAADGPIRLVTPNEQRAARSVRQVATITLIEVPAVSGEEPAPPAHESMGSVE